MRCGLIRLSSYKFNLTDKAGNQISRYPVDNIPGFLPLDSLNIHYDITASELSAGVTPVNYACPSPATAGIAYSARYFTANQLSNVTECSGILNSVAAMCATNAYVFFCAPADRFKTSATVIFTFPGQVRMNGALNRARPGLGLPARPPY